MKYIRWKAVVPLVIITAIVLVFCVFLIDGITRKVLVSAGEMIFSAKVNIGSVRIRFKGPSIEITGIGVADKDDPFKNLFEADRIKFGVSFIHLLSKRFIIDDIIVDGVRWSTRRLTSGALPPKKQKRIEKAKKKEDKDSITAKLLGGLKEKAARDISALPAVKDTKEAGEQLKAFDGKKLIDETADELESKKAIEVLNKEVSEKQEKYTAALNNIDVQQQVKTIQGLSGEISGLKVEKMEDVQPAQGKLSQMEAAGKSLEETRSKLDGLWKEASADITEKQKLVESINGLIQKDYEKLLAKVKLPDISKGNISQVLFGRMWLGRVNSVLGYIHLARKYMGHRKKGEKKTVRTRLKGVDVVFHRDKGLPGFLVRNARISATTGGGGKDEERAISLAGGASDWTSDPVLLGRPAKIKLEGKSKDRVYSVDGIFDHTGETPLDEISIEMRGMDIGGIEFGESEYLPAMKDGKIRIRSGFALKGDALDCRMFINVTGLKFAAIKGGGDEMQKVLNEVYRSIDSVEINARLYGVSGDLKSELNSNLDGLISNKLKSIYSAKTDEVRAKIKISLDEYVGAEKDNLLKGYNAGRENIEKMYSEKRKTIEEQKKIIEAKVREINDRINALKEQEKKKREKELKQKEEELKQKAAPQIEKLFKK